MGRQFVEHWGGRRIFECDKCDIYLSFRDNVVSTQFIGNTGRAFLFRTVANIRFGEVEQSTMTTGSHLIRRVFCKGCDAELGRMYEIAPNQKEQYKEGKVVLERKLIREREEIKNSSDDAVSEIPEHIETLADIKDELIGFEE